VSDTSVCVAYVHSNEVAHSWHRSLLDLVGWDLSREGHVLRGGWLAVRYGTDGLPGARNEAVKQFLGDRDAEWLFWVDTDMGFTPDTVDRLLEVADPVDRPIVGALCFAQRERTPDGMGGYRCTPAPTLYDWVRTGDVEGFLGRSQYPINTVERVAGTGSACVLIHRSVFERIQEASGPVWYDRVFNPSAKQLVGEDLSFCMRAGAVDVPVHVHTGVRTTHLKQFWLTEQDYWRAAVAPPAAEQTAVIVPVMRRPQNAAPFMQSLRASTGLARVYAVADSHDTATVAEWERAGATVLCTDHQLTDLQKEPRAGTFAEKVNLGYEQTAEPWLFLCGDDVRFHPGWLDHAQAVAGDKHHVVGTNDIANPRVTSGEHATHMLVRRSYVDEQGASWDGPKVVCHEGYRHWFVDNEIVTAAQQRGVWAMALGSIVEHRHPLFGTAENDEVYELGQSHQKQDYARFRQRLATYAPEVAGAR
jgi:hypothetical protein